MKSHRIQKLLSVFLGVVLVFCISTGVCCTPLCSIIAHAEQTSNGFQYISDSGKKTVQITGYTGSAHTLTIPSAIDGFSVTSLKSEAFKGKDTLLTISIPDTVTTIGSECFSGCTLLGSVELGKGVSTIGNKAFENCKMLSAVSLPAATASIGDLAFYGCTSISSFSVASGNVSFASKDGVLTNRLLKKLIAYPAGKTSATYTVQDVSTIEPYAFYGAKFLASVVVPDSVGTIGKGAFKDCSALAQVVLPSKLTKIEDEMFSGCKKLNALSFPTGVKTIGSNAFKDCASIPMLTVQESVTTIEDGAFSGCTGLETVSITKGLKDLSVTAFSGCTALKEFKVSTDASFSVEKGVLLNKSGSKLLVYPAGASDTEYTVGEKVTAIGANAFNSCRNLKKLTIPATVKTIDEPAVINCRNLVIHVEDNSEAKTYFQKHTDGYDALKIGSDKPGDVNGDGAVDNADAILLRRYVAKWKNISIHTDAADVNKDSDVDNADVILLRRFVAGWKNVTLK